MAKTHIARNKDGQYSVSWVMNNGDSGILTGLPDLPSARDVVIDLQCDDAAGPTQPYSPDLVEE